MKVLIIEPGKAPYVKVIDSSLESMQAVVGGSIEAVYPFDETVALVCNEEGKLLGLPLNRALRHPETDEVYDIVAGTFFLCMARAESEHFESLSEAQIVRYTERFRAPETFAKAGDTIVCVKDAQPVETTEICEHCGQETPISQLIQVGEDLLCPSCVAEYTTVCNRCGERIYTENSRGDDIVTLCQACFEDYYVACDRCGCLLRSEDACYAEDDEDEDHPLCDLCAEIRGRDSTIHRYDYRPEPIFYGNGLRHFGVELEIDGAGQSREHAQQILATANREAEHLYVKTDGSLDDGLELVSHPMTPDYHLSTMPWANVLEKAKTLDYTSHKAGTCGLHVHISRKAFGITDEEQEAAIARLVYFVEHFWAEILRFSRRTQSQADRWAARYGAKLTPQDTKSISKTPAWDVTWRST